jgi:hypothetical protein
MNYSRAKFFCMVLLQFVAIWLALQKVTNVRNQSDMKAVLRA